MPILKSKKKSKFNDKNKHTIEIMVSSWKPWNEIAPICMFWQVMVRNCIVFVRCLMKGNGWTKSWLESLIFYFQAETTPWMQQFEILILYTIWKLNLYF